MIIHCKMFLLYFLASWYCASYENVINFQIFLIFLIFHSRGSLKINTTLWISPFWQDGMIITRFQFSLLDVDDENWNRQVDMREVNLGELLQTNRWSPLVPHSLPTTDNFVVILLFFFFLNFNPISHKLILTRTHSTHIPNLCLSNDQFSTRWEPVIDRYSLHSYAI